MNTDTCKCKCASAHTHTDTHMFLLCSNNSKLASIITGHTSSSEPACRKDQWKFKTRALWNKHQTIAEGWTLHCGSCLTCPHFLP